jgi:hypothetical protein
VMVTRKGGRAVNEGPADLCNCESMSACFFHRSDWKAMGSSGNANLDMVLCIFWAA